MVIFENVFIENKNIFMDGEYDFAAMLVERFTTYHRRSYVCKSGVGDVLIGKEASILNLMELKNLLILKINWFKCLT